MPDNVRHYFKLEGVSPNFDSLPFGHQIDDLRKVQAFCESPDTKSVCISTKRRSVASALKEFKALYKPVQYYMRVRSGVNYSDDSQQVWYR